MVNEVNGRDATYDIELAFNSSLAISSLSAISVLSPIGLGEPNDPQFINIHIQTLLEHTWVFRLKFFGEMLQPYDLPPTLFGCLFLYVGRIERQSTFLNTQNIKTYV